MQGALDGGAGEPRAEGEHREQLVRMAMEEEREELRMVQDDDAALSTSEAADKRAGGDGQMDLFSPAAPGMAGKKRPRLAHCVPSVHPISTA